MGGFANSALNLLLGWVRGAAQWLWQLIESPNGSALINWLSKHWLAAVIVLCVVGVLADFVIYLFRWRPDQVWRSFFRRMAHRSPRVAQSVASQDKLRQWIYDEEAAQPADESVTDVQPEQTQAEQSVQQAQPVQSGQPVQPAQPAERRRRADRHRARNTLSRLLSTDDDADTFVGAYKPSIPVDSKQTLNEPYYPPQWKRPEDKNGANSSL